MATETTNDREALIDRLVEEANAMERVLATHRVQSLFTDRNDWRLALEGTRLRLRHDEIHDALAQALGE